MLRSTFLAEAGTIIHDFDHSSFVHGMSTTSFLFSDIRYSEVAPYNGPHVARERFLRISFRESVLFLSRYDLHIVVMKVGFETWPGRTRYFTSHT